MSKIAAILHLLLCLVRPAMADDLWVVFEGGEGPGNGHHIVFVTGDEEYRSEESMPQLAKILAVHHGFKCTVLFAINSESETIDPLTLNNIPGLELLESADLMVLFTRFRELPDKQMKHIIDYTDSGRPIIGLRTATHAFRYRKNKNSKYAKYSFKDKNFLGGYGRQVLGETWVNHYGKHNVESTRAVIAKGKEDHPIARGLGPIWGPSDVYGITTLAGDSEPLLMGTVLRGMNPRDPPSNEKNLVPIAWTKSYTGSKGKTSRVFTTTMGHSFDLKDQNLRRLLVNACYWGIKMEQEIPTNSKVDIVGDYNPSDIGYGKHRQGVKPSHHAKQKAP